MRLKKIKNYLGIFVISTLILIACKQSTNNLTEEVKKSMLESRLFKENSITIKSLILSRKTENEYDGVLETIEPNGEFIYKVAVVYDGRSFTWEVLD
jgi:hypothetical protein